MALEKNSYFNEFLYLLDESKKNIFILVLLFISNALLDVIGIGLIAPYISIVLDLDQNNNHFYKILNTLNLPDDRENLILIVSISI